MSCGEKIWIGADPGGTDNFGIAVLKQDGSALTICVNCADDAVSRVREFANSMPAGVGIDAPLWWSSGPSAGRAVDQWLRDTYHLSGGNVQAVNSLRGAALVQGAMFVYRMRQAFPAIPVTETHPKALIKALGLDADAFYQRYSVRAQRPNDRDHERDAIVSAVAAREGFEGR